MQSTCMAAIGGEGVYLLDNLNTLPNSSEPNMYILELFDQCATYPLSLSPPPFSHWRLVSVDCFGDLLIFLLQAISRLTLSVYFSFLLRPSCDICLKRSMLLILSSLLLCFINHDSHMGPTPYPCSHRHTNRT